MTKEMVMVDRRNTLNLKEHGIVSVCNMWGYDLEDVLEGIYELSMNRNANPGGNEMSTQINVEAVVMDRSVEFLEDVMKRNGRGVIGGRYKVDAIFFESEGWKELWDKNEMTIINNN